MSPAQALPFMDQHWVDLSVAAEVAWPTVLAYAESLIKLGLQRQPRLVVRHTAARAAVDDSGLPLLGDEADV